MRVSQAFPSNYLKAADLQGRNVPVTMNRVEMEDIGGDHKPVVYFNGKDKGVVLNKTNANNIAQLYGDDRRLDRPGRGAVFGLGGFPGQERRGHPHPRPAAATAGSASPDGTGAGLEARERQPAPRPPGRHE